MIPNLVFLMFFLSGAASLVYQIVWVRLAMATFGTITPVLSIVLSVFMGGIYVGSLVAARTCGYVRRTRPATGALLYAGAEALMAVGAFAVPVMYGVGERMLLTTGESQSGAYLVWSALAIVVAILPWCICMGLTVPWMLAFLEGRDEASRRHFSGLYLANLLGSMAGVIAAVFVLIELYGFRTTAMVAAGLNVFNAIAAFSLGVRDRAPAPQPASAASLGGAAPAADRGLAHATLFLTGFVSLALEVAWTRAFCPVLGTLVYAFGSVLFTYLGATAVGARLHRDGAMAWPVERLVGWTATASLLPLVATDPRLGVHALATLGSVVPFCLLLGVLTPRLIEDTSGGDPTETGRLYALNVIGCILGPLVAGYLLLPHAGVKWTMIVLALSLGLLALAWSRSARGEAASGRLAWRLAFAGTAAASMLAVTSYEEFYASPGQGGVVRSDYAATVISYGQGMKRHLMINGKSITFLTTITKTMAHLPMALHGGRPGNSLAICFGMGTTFRSLTTWGGEVTAVDLIPSVPKAFGYYFDDADEVMARPGAHVVVDDGRRFLKRTGERFDVITIDPPPPVQAAGSGLLYTKEFYETAKARLAPGGILQQWLIASEAPIVHAVARALVESFPHVVAFYSAEHLGLHFLASMEPIEVPDVDTVMSRMPAPAAHDLGEWLSIEWGPEETPRSYLARVLANRVDVQSLLGPPAVVMVDDHPVNEYFILRSAFPPNPPEKQYFE